MALLGEMNIYSAIEVKKAFLENIYASEEVSIDLSGVSELDTAGVQLLILARREAENMGKTLRIDAHSDATASILKLYGVRKYVDNSPRKARRAKTKGQ